jgi:hypothetical protein
MSRRDGSRVSGPDFGGFRSHSKQRAASRPCRRERERQGKCTTTKALATGSQRTRGRATAPTPPPTLEKECRPKKTSRRAKALDPDVQDAVVLAVVASLVVGLPITPSPASPSHLCVALFDLTIPARLILRRKTNVTPGLEENSLGQRNLKALLGLRNLSGQICIHADEVVALPANFRLALAGEPPVRSTPSHVTTPLQDCTSEKTTCVAASTFSPSPSPSL